MKDACSVHEVRVRAKLWVMPGNGVGPCLLTDLLHEDACGVHEEARADVVMVALETDDILVAGVLV